MVSQTTGVQTSPVIIHNKTSMVTGCLFNTAEAVTSSTRGIIVPRISTATECLDRAVLVKFDSKIILIRTPTTKVFCRFQMAPILVRLDSASIPAEMMEDIKVLTERE